MSHVLGFSQRNFKKHSFFLRCFCPVPLVSYKKGYSLSIGITSTCFALELVVIFTGPTISTATVLNLFSRSRGDENAALFLKAPQSVPLGNTLAQLLILYLKVGCFFFHVLHFSIRALAAFRVIPVPKKFLKTYFDTPAQVPY